MMSTRDDFILVNNKYLGKSICIVSTIVGL